MTTHHPTPDEADMHLVIISGMSGSGKSIALQALEDSGYYCVDNLPPELLLPFIEIEKQHQSRRIAVAMDARSSKSLPLIPMQVDALRRSGILVTALFLDASDPMLMRRFSETRRKHPLTVVATNDQTHDLEAAIALERKLLAEFRLQAHVIETTLRRPAQLRSQIKSLIAVDPQQLTLIFESFAFKRGVPADADYVFDVRMLPNPHYEPGLRELTGRDQPVIDFLEQQPDVELMRQHIHGFLRHWLPELAKDHRSYVTVAIGCTGGQHRSVYLVEKLFQDFRANWSSVLKRHREQDDH
ncbi:MULTISPECIES: RNase adapter RapZ [Brachymonas]|uniref:RNase adapter RapZ n=1 Tax=Brachymonas TaxID=28219 RepID=UPI0016BAD760|nr:RNase adapter RapZ [Brachymonas sp. J145]MEE1653122.1 RNase adapter RapZ [Brachymonas sp. J145]NLX16581.1 RNase adapter RapZ [Ramlibacter sp.]